MSQYEVLRSSVAPHLEAVRRGHVLEGALRLLECVFGNEEDARGVATRGGQVNTLLLPGKEKYAKIII